MYIMILPCLIKEFKIIIRRFWNSAGASQKPKNANIQIDRPGSQKKNTWYDLDEF